MNAKMCRARKEMEKTEAGKDDVRVSRVINV